MRRIKEVTPQAFRLLGDKTRIKIIYLLRIKELTISQISAELNLTPQTIYHHIKKLEGEGLVEVTREERIDHLIESYYQSTAETFLCSIGSLPVETAKKDVLVILEKLKEIGFKIETSEEIASRLVDFEKKMMEHKSAKNLEDAIGKLEETLDNFSFKMAKHYADLILMSEDEYKSKQELRGKLRQFLLSICKEKPEF
ncbi:MAG: ArsR/SmtB family transcription factor [Promethearchaeota archaeon]